MQAGNPIGVSGGGNGNAGMNPHQPIHNQSMSDHHIPSKEILEDASIIEEYNNNEVKRKKISTLCYDVCYKYNSRSFRDNPLLVNKGRIHGYFDSVVQPVGHDRA